MPKINFPKKCSDDQLDEIINEPNQDFLDFPYSPMESRYMMIIDYQEEQLRRRQEAGVNLEKTETAYLIRFMEKLYIHAPVLSIALQAALTTCKATKGPTPLLFESANICRDFTSRHFVAHYAVRIAVKRLTGKTLVATSPENFWVLPESINVFEWVQKKAGFATALSVGAKHPRASAIFAHLANVAREKSEHMAITKIDDPVSLNQLVDILAVYPHYYPLEDVHRAAFALVHGDTVVAHTIYSRVPDFIKLTSPEAQLEAWNTRA